MPWLRELTGALPRVPLVLAVGLSLSAGAAGAYVGPDDVTPPYGWGLSALSQPVGPLSETTDDSDAATPVVTEATAPAASVSGTQD